MADDDKLTAAIRRYVASEDRLSELVESGASGYDDWAGAINENRNARAAYADVLRERGWNPPHLVDYDRDYPGL